MFNAKAQFSLCIMNNISYHLYLIEGPGYLSILNNALVLYKIITRS